MYLCEDMNRPFLTFFLVFVFQVCCLAQSRDLDYYIKVALTSNPLLKDLNNQTLINEIDSQRITAGYKPQVSGIGNATYSPYVNGYGYDPVLSNIGALNAMVNVNKTFVGKKNLSTQYAALHLNTDSLRNSQKIAEQDLKRSITTQYIVVWGDLQQQAFNKELINTLQNQELVLKNLTQSNIYRQTDYLAFLVALQQQILQLKQLNIQTRVDFGTLNYLCGIADTSAPELAEPGIGLENLPELDQSIFMLRYKTDSLKLENQLGLLSYSYRPKLSGFANGGYSSSFIYEAYKNFGYSMGLNFTVPIYDGHQRKMQVDKIHLAENSRATYQSFFMAQYNQQLTQLRQQIAATESLIADINEQIKYAEGLIKVNSKLLETGDAKISDYVMAINNYLTAKNLLTQNNISKLQIINQINYWNR